MNKGKLVSVILAILLVIGVVFGWDQYEKRRFLQDNIDHDFQANFSMLCGVLKQEASDTEKWTAKTQIYAHTMLTLLAETSYTESEELSSVVQLICSWAQLGELHEKMNAELIESLSRLAYDLENEELAGDILKLLSEK